MQQGRSVVDKRGSMKCRMGNKCEKKASKKYRENRKWETMKYRMGNLIIILVEISSKEEGKFSKTF